jgi:NRAMP (natural resistance-associated macrophage protein)-like metal ion transporter
MEEMAKKLGFKRFFKKLGPGFITGAADDDPSGIATYAQTGAIFGYRQLWLSVFTIPFMITVQEMCGRIGIVTGKGLAGAIGSRYGKIFLFFAVFLLFIANVVNIGADLGAMASAGTLLWGIPFVVWIGFFTALILFLQISIPYPRYAKILKYLTFSLLAYVVTLFLVGADWGSIFRGAFLPHFSFSKDFILNVVAFLGTTISPYLFFWQSDEEVEEEIATGKLKMMGKGIPKISGMDIRNMRADTVIGMFFSNLVSFFIIATCAATLHAEGITNIETADQAAAALLPLAGPFAFALFALGIISTGLLAVPILAGGASYAVSESMGWAEGLGKRFSQAKAFYLTIAVATGLGLFINFLGIPPFQMLYYAAVVNGVCAPPLIFAIVALSRDKKTMGKYASSRGETILGIFIGGVMLLAACTLFYFLFFST